MCNQIRPTPANRWRRSGILAYRVAAGLAIASTLASKASADPVVNSSAPYVEVAQALERWIGAEAVAKELPAVSIALIDDQRIVWARGFGVADQKRRTPA